MKVRNWKPLSLSMFFFPVWHVKGLSSRRTVLKVEVLKDWKIYCFAGASVHLSARKFFQVGAVKGLNKPSEKPLDKRPTNHQTNDKQAIKLHTHARTHARTHAHTHTHTHTELNSGHYSVNENNLFVTIIYRNEMLKIHSEQFLSQFVVICSKLIFESHGNTDLNTDILTKSVTL